MKKFVLTCLILSGYIPCFCWGFFAHKKINGYAVFLLPPQMLVLYKPRIDFITEHAVDPDKRRYVIRGEGPRHFIDMDHYGRYPFDSLPRAWVRAAAKFSADSLQKYGIVPWWVQVMLHRLTDAFKERNQAMILKLSAEIGHYIADAHVPLHASSNHNGQLTGQQGIHGFWESRVPELLADREWDFFIGRAIYIKDPASFIWQRVMESAAAADTVLLIEKQLTAKFRPDEKYSFEIRNGVTIRQYSTAFTKAYDARLKGMVERRMRSAILSVASFWYTAWVNAGEPDLTKVSHKDLSPADLKDFEELNRASRGNNLMDREHD